MRSLRLLSIVVSTGGSTPTPTDINTTPQTLNIAGTDALPVQTNYTPTAVFYNKWYERIGDATMTLSTATIKCALTSDSTAPGGGATATDPRWGAGGTENLSTNEVSAGGNYTAGGVTISSGDPWATVSNQTNFTAQAASWLKAAGSPTNIRYAVVYEDTTKYAIMYIPLFSDVGDLSLVDNNLKIKWENQATSGKLFYATAT